MTDPMNITLPDLSTEHRVSPPPLTEEGTMIMVSSDGRTPHILLTLEAGQWVNRYGLEWRDDEIASWAPVTIGETVMR